MNKDNWIKSKHQLKDRQNAQNRSNVKLDTNLKSNCFKPHRTISNDPIQVVSGLINGILVRQPCGCTGYQVSKSKTLRHQIRCQTDCKSMKIKPKQKEKTNGKAKRKRNNKPGTEGRTGTKHVA